MLILQSPRLFAPQVVRSPDHNARSRSSQVAQTSSSLSSKSTLPFRNDSAHSASLGRRNVRRASKLHICRAGAAAKTVLVPVANGSEEIEAVTIIDVLRRAGAEVTVASVEDSLQVEMSRQVRVVADKLISDCATETFDAIALPVRKHSTTYTKSSSGRLCPVCFHLFYRTHAPWLDRCEFHRQSSDAICHTLQCMLCSYPIFWLPIIAGWHARR